MYRDLRSSRKGAASGHLPDHDRHASGRPRSLLWYANGSTPALDALAKDGLRFTEAFTPSPITNTSHASILTGLLPGSHGVTDFAVPLSTTHPTVAEMLKARGYHTAAFIGAVILDSKTLAPGFDRGFDFYDNFPEHTPTKSRWGRLERRGMDVVQHAESWLTKHPAGPNFVWVHLYDPHDPYEPPRRTRKPTKTAYTMAKLHTRTLPSRTSSPISRPAPNTVTRSSWLLGTTEKGWENTMKTLMGFFFMTQRRMFP